ncbi:hypothetical protein IC617_08190 [Neiella sp. HB171785]|uniref:Uncharacterized protein n=1 Tax=Neiella litorisoli TaxID=2771431 RepID=A0A8J6UIX9_9GAMM|nr:hypothetical protein [Neiella litorisoli]MBD1389403.1 hypothetical protein [Neiella litorisoli]
MTDASTSTEPKFSLRVLTYTDLEPYLKLPSGLALSQAKRQAKELKKAQGMSQTEALRFICWGNGLPSIRDISQGFEDMVQATFGCPSASFGLVLNEGEIDGYVFTLNDGTQRQCRMGFTATEDKVKAATESLVSMLLDLKKSKGADARFLQALKDIIRFVGTDFLALPNGMTLDDVTSKHELGINLRQLLFGDGSGGQRTMRYVIASCYNTRATQQYVAEQMILAAGEEHDLSQVAWDNEDDVYHSVTRHANQYFSFGAMCWNLDETNKRLIKQLLDNYQGW